jgi:two-component system OmpR family sensor kinase
MRHLRRLPIRVRLAIISAGLTFVILMLFAVVIGHFAANQVRSSFDHDLQRTVTDLAERVPVQTTDANTPVFGTGLPRVFLPPGDEVIEAAASGNAVLRVVTPSGTVTHQNQNAADLGPPAAGIHDYGRYRVATRAVFEPGGPVVAYIQYAKPHSSVDATVDRIRLFLAFGVVGGAGLAFLAGLALAGRAMRPVVNLTRAAREIERTRDPAVTLPMPEADDEVADLARTLEDMLRALDAARRETEGALTRQRQFVADASHELRTPLTSILANLELLEAELEGEEAEAAGAALRSSKRMRRLVANLLLLARADAGREGLFERVDLGRVVREAASEAVSVAADHRLTIDAPAAGPAVQGVADDLHRLTLNLIENSLVHTPPGTEVTIRVREEAGGVAVLDVEDAGPGIPVDVRERIFDRFVRAAGDTGGGSGLGLAIVRAVAERHGGSVEAGESPAGGARFTVRLPAAPDYPPPRPDDRVPGGVTPLRRPAAPSAGA